MCLAAAVNVPNAKWDSLPVLFRFVRWLSVADRWHQALPLWQ